MCSIAVYSIVTRAALGYDEGEQCFLWHAIRRARASEYLSKLVNEESLTARGMVQYTTATTNEGVLILTSRHVVACWAPKPERK
jgi:hypothetical protein